MLLDTYIYIILYYILYIYTLYILDSCYLTHTLKNKQWNDTQEHRLGLKQNPSYSARIIKYKGVHDLFKAYPPWVNVYAWVWKTMMKKQGKKTSNKVIYV